MKDIVTVQMRDDTLVDIRFHGGVVYAVSVSTIHDAKERAINYIAARVCMQLEEEIKDQLREKLG